MYIKELTPLLVVILLLLYLCLVRWRSAKYKGQIGEKCVSSILSTLPSNYYLFNNIYLQNGTHSTQIDHVIVSPYGIFVIETKNYKGWIYGTKHGEYWTQNIYGVRYSLQNPIRQNYVHTRALQELLGVPLDMFIQVVVFMDKAELKGEQNDGVVYLSQLQDFVLSHSVERLTDEEVESFTALLLSSCVRDTNMEKRHILSVQQRIQERQRLIESHVCPRCGGRLIVRYGAYGSFLGCSSFPRCRFTLSLRDS
jgi:DNA-binding protein